MAGEGRAHHADGLSYAPLACGFHGREMPAVPKALQTFGFADINVNNKNIWSHSVRKQNWRSQDLVDQSVVPKPAKLPVCACGCWGGGGRFG